MWTLWHAHSKDSDQPMHPQSDRSHPLVLIAPDKVIFSNQNFFIFFLFLHKKYMCEYSSEAPHQGTSNEYPQHVFV